MEPLFRVFFTRHHTNRTTKKILSTLSLCSAVFTGAVFAVPDIYNPQTSFLNQVQNTTGQSNAALESAYLNQIIELTYNGATDCGGGPCRSSIDASRISLEQWKTLNGFTPANKEKVTTVRYYNSADLGLGRDMNCVDQSANTAPGASVLACYVSNHGSIGGGAEAAFKALATLDDPTEKNPSKPFATVAMEIRPKATKNKVRFLVFGKDDQLVNLGGLPGIVLDSGTGHEQPAVCMNCHGGKFTAVDNIEKAHFLPFDFNSLEFPSPEARNEAISKVNTLNQLIRNAEYATYKETPFSGNEASPLRIVNYLNSEYLPSGSAIDAPFPTTIPAQAMKDSYVEPKFNNNANDQLLYKTVVRNYCRTCHLAVRNELKPADVVKHVCAPDSEMPLAEVNAKNLLSHMDEIAAIVYKVSGNRNIDCFKMPVLNDFQWSAAEGKSIITTPSMVIAPSAIATQVVDGKDVLNGFAVGFQSKRTLKLAPTSISGSLIVEAPKVAGQYVKSINEVTFLASPLPADGSGRIFAELFNAEGAPIGYATTADNSSLTPTAVTGSPFSKYSLNIPSLGLGATVKKVELHLIRVPKSNIYNFATNLEIDDVSVTYDLNAGLGQNIFAVEDFEDQLTTYASTGTALGTIDVQPYSITGTSCSNLRTNNRGFSISGALKVGRDSGRYSLASNPIFCVGERTTLRVKLNNNSTGDLKVGRLLSFDFVIDKQSDGTSPVGILTLPEITNSGNSPFDALDVARHQGTLSETPSQFFGHITLRAFDYFQPFSWTPLINSGVAGAPIKGVALDNFTMWDAPQ